MEESEVEKDNTEAEQNVEKIEPEPEKSKNSNSENVEKQNGPGFGRFKMPDLPLSMPTKRKSDVKASVKDVNPTHEEVKPTPDEVKSTVEDVTPSNDDKDAPQPETSITTTEEDIHPKASDESKTETKTSSTEKKSTKSPAELAQAKSIPLAYQEPSWGGIPEGKPYSLEVLKNGTIIDTIELKDKSFFVVGRLATCDITMEHPSLSRHHAVLQFKSKGSPEKPQGFYLYDLDSTHGSFHNKNKCFPKTFYRLRVGHMLKFGMSTRSLILQGPDDDSEQESELSITELKALAAEKAQKKAEEHAAAIKKLEEGEDKEGGEEGNEGGGGGGGGISWGMGDDADDEFPDMDQNPFAETADNERLYINDPKKALANWFEREGYDLEYEVEEKGYAQFLCKIHLPIDVPSGVNTVAQATVKGKKKEATVQTALEACRMLDRLNLLNPKQESAVEKKVKRWEEDDFYASDEDEFLDRTGSIQVKRKQRMKIAGKLEDKAETYESLVEKHRVNKEELEQCEKELKEALTRKEKADNDSDNLDLDSYLAELKKGAQVDKQTIQKLKVRISSLNQEIERLTKLINIAKPASLPELKSNIKEKPKLSGIMIGKRGSKGLLGKVKTMTKENKTQVVIQTKDTKVLEAFLDKDDKDDIDKVKRSRLCNSSDEEDEIKPIGYEPVKEAKRKERIGDTSINALNKILGPRGPEIPEHVRAALEQKLKGGDINSMTKETINAALLNAMEDKIRDGDQMDVDDMNKVPGDDSVEDVTAGVGDYEDLEPAVKKKRGDRGSRRKKKADDEAEEGEGGDDYYKVGMDSKYDVWQPPTGQTGDGRTSLNEKLGY